MFQELPKTTETDRSELRDAERGNEVWDECNRRKIRRYQIRTKTKSRILEHQGKRTLQDDLEKSQPKNCQFGLELSDRSLFRKGKIS